MKKLIEQVEAIFIESTVWVFFTLILGTSFWCMQIGQVLTWENFLGWTLTWTILFLPVLIFSVFKDSFAKRFQKKIFWTIWIFVFLLYPLLSFVLQSETQYFDSFKALIGNQKIEVFSFTLVAGLMLVLELLLMFSKKRGISSKWSKWVLNLNIPKLALICIAVFAFFLPFVSTYFQEMISKMSFARATGWYLYYAVQIFIIYGTYYLYYHIHHYFLFNKLLKEKGLFYYAMGLLAMVLILTPICNHFFAFFPVVYDLKVHTTGLTTSIFDVINYSIPISILIFSFPLILIVEWYKQANTLTELEKEKSQAELDLLKQQINPHFFFNTLNNLYSMSLTKDAETPETILQLSELMRYVIYKGKEEKVKLSEDLKYIQDYIDLQQIRIHKSLDFNFEKDIKDLSLKIPPLLFIILVENAFKHGIEPAEEKCFLNIKLVQKENTLDFTCHNSFEPQEEKATGIGLENLRRRLEILFPGRFSLSVKKNTSDYQARLIIPL